MKVSRKQFAGRVINLCHNDYPSNLCTTFWVFIISLITMPIIYPVIFINRLDEKTWTSYNRLVENIMIGLICQIFSFVCLMSAASVYMGLMPEVSVNTKELNIFQLFPFWYWLLLPVGNLLLAVTVLIIGMVVYMIYQSVLGLKKIFKVKKKQEDTSKPKKPNIILEFIKAKKEKICPLIEWE